MNENLLKGPVPPLALIIFGVGCVIAGIGDNVNTPGGTIEAVIGIASIIMAGYVYYDD